MLKCFPLLHKWPTNHVGRWKFLSVYLCHIPRHTAISHSSYFPPSSSCNFFLKHAQKSRERACWLPASWQELKRHESHSASVCHHLQCLSIDHIILSSLLSSKRVRVHFTSLFLISSLNSPTLHLPMGKEMLLFSNLQAPIGSQRRT